MLNDRAPLEPDESFARVLRRALGIVVAYWVTCNLPASHPYRQAAQTVIGYLERRYKV